MSQFKFKSHAVNKISAFLLFMQRWLQVNRQIKNYEDNADSRTFQITHLKLENNCIILKDHILSYKFIEGNLMYQYFKIQNLDYCH